MTRRAEILYAFEAYYWADTAPWWAYGPANGGHPTQCGDCGAWMTIVRPGKSQCDACDWLEGWRDCMEDEG